MVLHCIHQRIEAVARCHLGELHELHLNRGRKFLAVDLAVLDLHKLGRYNCSPANSNPQGSGKPEIEIIFCLEMFLERAYQE